MEPEENGSKADSRWEQSAMSEGAAYPHEMGAISHVKPKGGNAQPHTESGKAEHQINSILFLVILSVFSKFVFCFGRLCY